MVARKIDCEFYRLRRIVDDYMLERACQRVGRGARVKSLGMTAHQPVVGRKQNFNAPHDLLYGRQAGERGAAKRTGASLVKEFNEPVSRGACGAVIDRAQQAEIPGNALRVAL